MGLLDSSKHLGEKLSQLEKLRQSYLACHSVSEKKKKLREQVESLEWEIVEQALVNRGRQEALRELANHRRDNRRSYFLWKFYFPQAFRNKGGFDVVLANPPYVRQEEIKELKPALKRNYSAFTGTADLYVYFYECALKLLNKAGTLAFITSNKYFRAGYGEKLRALLAQQTRIDQLIDFGDAPVFDATAYASIVILQRQFAEANEARAWSLPPGEPIHSFEQQFNQNCLVLPQHELKSDGWRLESSTVLRLMEKLRNAGTPLGEYVEGRFYRGILTGLNEAFVVDRETRDRLIAEDKSSAALLKPFLRGRDIKRWNAEFAEQYLIKIESSENKKHPWSEKDKEKAERVFAKTYPAIYRHFQRLRSELVNRYDQGQYFWELRSCIYWAEFERPKILYQEIATFQAFSYDKSGSLTNNKTFLLPTNDLSLLGILNSKVAWWFLHQVCSKLQGGALAMQTPYISQLPIAKISQEQQAIISKLVSYILFLKANVAAEPRDQPMVSYSERMIDALVYELYLPEEIHAAGLAFCAPLVAEKPPALEAIKGDKLSHLRQIFARLCARSHLLQRNLAGLDAIASVRIIEGKP